MGIEWVLTRESSSKVISSSTDVTELTDVVEFVGEPLSTKKSFE